MTATDFFTVEVWTPRGLVTYYILFIIHLSTRAVHIAGVTMAPQRRIHEAGGRQPDRRERRFSFKQSVSHHGPRYKIYG